MGNGNAESLQFFIDLLTQLAGRRRRQYFDAFNYHGLIALGGDPSGPVEIIEIYLDEEDMLEAEDLIQDDQQVTPQLEQTLEDMLEAKYWFQDDQQVTPQLEQTLEDMLEAKDRFQDDQQVTPQLEQTLEDMLEAEYQFQDDQQQVNPQLEQTLDQGTSQGETTVEIFK
jgi:hypothetical protein